MNIWGRESENVYRLMYCRSCGTVLQLRTERPDALFLYAPLQVCLFVGIITLLGFFNLVLLLHTKDGFVNVGLLVLQ